jgi:hypothetical protein
LNDLPDGVRRIFKRLNKAPLSLVSEQLQAGRTLQEMEAKRAPLPRVSPGAASTGNVPEPVPPAPVIEPRAKVRSFDAPGPGSGKTAANDSELKNRERPDWNPDSRWAAQRGYTIHYSSSRNAVLCPELKIGSDRSSLVQRSGPYGAAGSGQGSVGVPQPVVSGSAGDAGAQAKARDEESGKKENSGK